MIETSKEFWKQVQEKGGLKATDDAYDKPIIQALVKGLNFSSQKEFQHALDNDQIAIEDFLCAFFSAVEPYAMMMGDLLKMFQQIGVKHSGENLEISFDFGNENAAPLTFKFEEFKNWKEKWEEAKSTFAVLNWNVNTLWQLNGVFSDWRLGRSQRQDVVKWLEVYYNGHWPEELPGLPFISDTKLRESIEKVWRVVRSFVAAASAISPQRIKFNTPTDNIPTDKLLWDIEVVKIVETDNWAGSIVSGILGYLELIQSPDFHVKNTLESLRPPINKVTSPGPADIVRRLNEVFDSLPVSQKIVKEKVKIIEEFLDLPIWRRRHELYSMWVSTQIAEAIGYSDLRIHHAGNTLKFAFSGTHFATTNATAYDPTIHVWAELRSPLANPVGKTRTANIQPDYTIVSDPVTSPLSAVTVVECKQYKKQSKASFIAALLDYANGRPQAVIILVNYGPASPALLSDSSLTIVKDRLRIIGHMHPGRPDAIQTFRSEIQDSLKKYKIVSNATLPVDPDSGTGEIQLRWGAQPRDLDLKLAIASDPEFTISYSQRGTLDESPWAELLNDVTSGHGPETIVISKWLPTKYRILVHNFSGENNLKDSEGHVSIDFNGQKINVDCPFVGEGTSWIVGEIDGADRSFTVINRIE